MHVEWYGQCAFRLTDESTRVLIDPFGDMTPMLERGMRWDYPAIAGVEGRSAARHPRAPRPQRRRGRRWRPGDAALDRRTRGVADRRGAVHRLRARRSRRHRARRQPLFVFTLAGRRVAHLGDLGQRALRDEQLAALGTIDLLFVPVGGGPTIGSQQATEIGAAMGASVIVPMHYKTERIDFLEPVDEFADRAARVERPSSPAFDALGRVRANS